MKSSRPLLVILLAPLAVLQVASVQGIERPDTPIREVFPGLRIEARTYPEHEATEWQFRLRAPAEGESPLYENLKSADFEVAFPSGAPVTLHWSKGSHSDPGDFVAQQRGQAAPSSRCD